MIQHEPADLDQRRRVAGFLGAETRRHALKDLEPDDKRLRSREADREEQMVVEPSETWSGAAARSIDLLQLLATCPEARDRRIARLLERPVLDLHRFSRRDAMRAAERARVAVAKGPAADPLKQAASPPNLDPALALRRRLERMPVAAARSPCRSGGCRVNIEAATASLPPI